MTPEGKLVSYIRRRVREMGGCIVYVADCPESAEEALNG